MLVIGVVGGIASGKSFVAEQFCRLGAEAIDADRIGHEVLEDPEVIEAIRDRWGEQVIAPEGRVDRNAVANIVFAPPPEGPEQLTFLEHLTHPLIGQRMRRRVAEMADRGVQVAIVDAAMLFEANWDRYCDKIVFVEASHTQRLNRACQRGWSRAEFSAREAAQENLDEKRKRADWIIDNNGSPEHTLAQVQRFWQTLA